MGNHNEKTPVGKLKAFLLEITGWLIPLLISAPSLFIWAGLMTMPLVVYLAIMFLSLFNSSITIKCCDQPYFLVAMDVMLLGGPYWPDKFSSILGVCMMLYATVYLNVKRKYGLVTSGPYRFVRNPQYFGALLFIINMTSRSYREVLGDVGWIGPQGTLILFFVTLVAYIVLALIEDAHLSHVFGEQYAAYRAKTAFLIPFAVTKSKAMDVLISLVVPIALLWGLVYVNSVLYP